MCSFELDFKRSRGCNYGIPRLSQNKMKRLYVKKYIILSLSISVLFGQVIYGDYPQ